MQTILEVESIELLDFDYSMPCEGANHTRGLSGHQPDAPGAFMVISPCCGPRVIQCAPRVAAMRFSGTLFCSICNTEHIVEEYTFVPLDSL